ncbi:amidoligase family protein [Peribacillus butanolivorans]|uniref:amidoligase family protein n=1 Tax=Peribacillus butanolivorans TaxID=421767 RepID=UPI0037C66B88
MRALREAGAGVNESCDIHIHVGADQQDVKSLKNHVKKGINIYGSSIEERCGSSLN